jgi:Ca2+-binding EF-hand superfamily protein
MSKLLNHVKNNKKSFAELFSDYDSSKDNKLSIYEFQNLIWKIAPSIKKDEIFLLFEEFDDDGDNSISLIEFQEMLKKYIHHGYIPGITHYSEGYYHNEDEI